MPQCLQQYFGRFFCHDITYINSYGTPGLSYVNLLYYMQCSSHYMQYFFLLDVVLLSLYVLFIMLYTVLLSLYAVRLSLYAVVLQSYVVLMSLYVVIFPLYLHFVILLAVICHYIG